MIDEKQKQIMVYVFLGFFIFATGILLMNTINDVFVVNLPVEDNGGVAVNIQDQTTRPFDLKINQIIGTGYTLANTPEVNQNSINLTDVTGLVVGDTIAVLEQNGMPQFLIGFITAINGNTVTMDTPVPFAYTTNATIFESPFSP